MLGICVHQGHASNDAIRETGQFSVNVPSVDMVAVTDYCGVVSGRKVDKSKLFDVFYGELKAAPLIRECPLSIECRLFQAVDLPTNTFFIGFIMPTWGWIAIGIVVVILVGILAWFLGRRAALRM
jgi:flavin reductase (DIM6/NTAB) family NADH-FMN oxidoreductase RutF